jgi:hypothetical protein
MYIYDKLFSKYHHTVAQLLITVLSCGTLGVVSSVWGLVEGIMILAGKNTVDGKGQALKD